MTNVGGDAKLEVRGISKTFGTLAALQAVTLAVREGELLSLLGPSGCGKTTLLRIIAGLDFSTAGRVLIDGRDVTDIAPRFRRVGMVFQHYALFPHMTVSDNVAYGLRMRRLPAARVKEQVAQILGVVQLEGTEGRFPRQLSGGQQQRVALARALVTEPAILLLDEPLSALDLKLRQQMQLEFRRIQRQLGITTIYVTHDQTEALTLSDRIAVFNSGRLVQIGSGPEVYDKPATRFVARFVGEASVLTGQVRGPVAEGVRVDLPGNIAVVTSLTGNLPAPGNPVSLVVRPERVNWLRPGQAAYPGYNEVTAVLHELVYLGDTFMGTAYLPGGIGLRFHVPPGNWNIPEVGQTVRLAFASDAVWPVAAEES